MFRTLLAIALPAALLVGQGRPGAERLRSEGGDPHGRHQLYARLNLIRAQRIQSSLGVPAALAKNIADRWGELDQEASARREGMHGDLQKLQEVLIGPGTEEEKNLKVVAPMAQFSTLQKQQREAKFRFEEEIKNLLTPVQQARFLILMDDFQRKLMDAMREHH